MSAAEQFIGFLLKYEGSSPERADLVSCPGINFKNAIGRTRWDRYTFSYPEPLRNEEPIPQIRKYGGSDYYEEFHYPLICRRSGQKLLILSSHRDVVDKIANESLSKGFHGRFHRVSIAVDKLVKKLTLEPTTFVLSAVFAKTPGYVANMRSASFYGDDIAEATIFKENYEQMNFTGCGLRRASGGNEILKLYSDGAISFVPSESYKEKKVKEVEQTLSFLSQEDYLEDMEL